MHVVCPHCRIAVEVVEQVTSEVVACASCGSSFRLETGSTTGWVRQEGEKPGRNLGRFELLAALGQGAFGTVYRARDPELDRTVAVKVPRAGNLTGPHELERFLREARSAARLRHPSIVSVHEVGQADGVPYLVSDFVEGMTLAELLAARRPTFREAAGMVAAIADALHFAHESGVIHRDVKPANVMIDAEGRPCVMDFGLAKRDAGELTVTLEGQVLGTPAYMSPEQARGAAHAVDGRTDVYSLGVMLYQMLTGELPFRGSTRMVLHQVLHDDPTPPRALNDRVPRDLETICLKAMARESGRRYLTAQELAEDLRRWMNGDAIKARPVSAAERIARWLRRRPALAGLLGVSAVAVLALGGLLAGLVYNRRLDAALQAEESQRRAAEQAQDGERQQRGVAEAALLRTERLSYFLRLGSALQQYRDSNVLRAELLLEECPTGQRHWEWHYLRAACRGDLHTYRGYDLQVFGADFTPDGKRVVSGGFDGTVRVLEPDSGKAAVIGKHREPVHAIAVSPDGRRVASGGEDGTVRLWDLRTSSELLRLGVEDLVEGLTFSRDGRRLAIVTQTRGVLVCDGATGDVLSRFTGQRGPTWGTAFSPDGKQAVSCGSDRVARIWDVATGRERLVLRGHTGYVLGVAWSPDGFWIASAAQGDAVRVWDAETGREVRAFRGPESGARSVAFAPDGDCVVSGSYDGTVLLSSLASGGEVLRHRGHTGLVYSVAFSADGSKLVSASADKTVKVWGPTAGPDGSVLGNPRSEQIFRVAFGPDGSRFAVADQARGEGNVRLHDPRTGRVLLRLPGHKAGAVSVAFSPDGSRLASVSPDRTVQLWDAATGKAIRTMHGHGAAVLDVAFSPDGRRLVSGSQDRTARVWDAETGNELLSLTGHEDSVRGVAFSPDGQWIATAGYDRTVRLWHAGGSEAGRELRRLEGNGDRVEMVRFSPDGKRLAAAILNGNLRLWEAETGNPLLLLRGHTTFAKGLDFSRDGLRLVSAGHDGTVKLWDVELGQETLSLATGPYESGLNTVAFSPDGQSILAGGFNGTLRIWETNGGWKGLAAERLPLWQARTADVLWYGRNWPAAIWHLDRLLTDEPDRAVLYQRRGVAYAELGRWKEAEADLGRALEKGARTIDALEGRALLRLGLGDAKGHAADRRELLRRFGDATDPEVVRRVVQTVCVTPVDEADRAELLRRAAEVVGQQPRRFGTVAALAAAHYRNGDWEAAERQFREYNGSRSRLPEAELFEAMAQHRVGKTDAARQSLDRVTRWIEAMPPPHPLGPAAADERAIPWQLRLSLPALRKEAEELINPSKGER